MFHYDFWGGIENHLLILEMSALDHLMQRTVGVAVDHNESVDDWFLINRYYFINLERRLASTFPNKCNQ